MSELVAGALSNQNPGGGPEPSRASEVEALPKAPALAIRDLSMLLALLAIGAFFAVKAPNFLGARNLSKLAIDLSITAVLALGMLLVLLPGHIDLSAGSSAALFGGIAAVLVFQFNWNATLALVVATLAALLVYWLMGLLIIMQKVPAFIITLGGLLVFRGLQWQVIQSRTIPVSVGGQENVYSRLTTYYLPPAASWVLATVVVTLMGIAALTNYRRRRVLPGIRVDGESDFMRWFVSAQLVALFTLICNGFAGLPLPAIILGAVAFLIFVLTRHTAFGRYLYAIGGNEEAAHVSGVPVRRVVIGAFVLMGAIVALTGFLQTAFLGSNVTTTGEQMELDAIAACVIGGTSLRGGRGTVSGVLFGSLIMAALINGMTLMAVSPEMKYIARGTVLALAVWVDVRLAGR